MKKKENPYRRGVRQVFAIASVTFHELLREKILWSAILFAVLCVALSVAASQLSFNEQARIALDFGLTSVSVIGGLISVIMGASLIAKEVHHRTLYLVLTKAVWRWQFVVGKFLGLLALITLNSLLISAIAVGIYLALGGDYHATIAQNWFLQMSEFAVLSAIACVFSAFSTATLSAILTAGIWIMGHAMTDFQALIPKMEPEFIRPILHFVARILPDLTRFDVKVQVSHFLPLTWSYTAVTILYGAAYVIFALGGACLIFSRRDL